MPVSRSHRIMAGQVSDTGNQTPRCRSAVIPPPQQDYPAPPAAPGYAQPPQASLSATAGQMTAMARRRRSIPAQGTAGSGRTAARSRPNSRRCRCHRPPRIRMSRRSRLRGNIRRPTHSSGRGSSAPPSRHSRRSSQQNPRDPLASSAAYWIGHSYFARGDFPERRGCALRDGYKKIPQRHQGSRYAARSRQDARPARPGSQRLRHLRPVRQAVRYRRDTC